MGISAIPTRGHGWRRLSELMPACRLGMAFLPNSIFFSGSGPLVDSVLHAVRAAPCGPEDRANRASWTPRTAAPLERRRSSRPDRSTPMPGPEPGAGRKWRHAYRCCRIAGQGEDRPCAFGADRSGPSGAVHPHLRPAGALHLCREPGVMALGSAGRTRALKRSGAPGQGLGKPGAAGGGVAALASRRTHPRNARSSGR